jgi:type IX secretion system PorP/SprF family membrane protein
MAQDPNFSQYMSSPLSISPALTGKTEANWRVSSILRSQSTGIGTPYTTKSISVEGKIKNKYDEDYWGIGGMILLDAAMDGIYKSTYVSLNTAYHLQLDGNGNGLAVGLGIINNKTLINFNELSFDQQLSNMGFNRALPQGEPSLSNNPSFTSVCAGLMYSFASDNTSVNIGASGYRFIKSKKSILDDATQYDAPRYTIHADMSTLLNERLNLSLSGVHMFQNSQSNTTIGGIFSFIYNNEFDVSRSFNLGSFYRFGNAIIPYAGFEVKNFQIGITYDVYTSSQTSANTPKTFEISLNFKHFASDLINSGKYHPPY